MIAATLLGVFFIPALYVAVSELAERIAGKPSRLAPATPAAAAAPAIASEPT